MTDDEAYEDRERGEMEDDRRAEIETELVALRNRVAELEAAQAASAERVRSVVREAIRIPGCEQFEGVFIPHRDIDAIADRVAAQLAAPPPGHVCPVPYGLGPEDLNVIDRLRERAHGQSLAVLDKILAAHRALGAAP